MSEYPNGLAYECFEVAAAMESIRDHLEDSDEFVGDGILLGMLAERLDRFGGAAEETETALTKATTECDDAAAPALKEEALGKNMEALHILRKVADHSPEWADAVWKLAGDAQGYAEEHRLISDLPSQ